jgi:predicted ATPase/DNA-binding winged helix-turn-helix (wHTH) protein
VPAYRVVIQVAFEIVQFGDFELDRSAHELRCGGVVVKLERIPLELLFLLVNRRGQIVTREEILERVWGKGVFVDSENSINTAVRKVRRALSDDPEAPRFVVTVPARGYRFVAEIRAPKTSRTAQFRARPPRGMVGRERELASMLTGLDDAASRRGRLFLISGEPGVGKTRLADELAIAADAKRMAVLVGHCSEHDEAVAYLPFVEILEDFIDRESNPDALRAALGDQAPELARLIPKLRNILPELPLPVDLPPAQARRHLFNCFFDFIARIASVQPTLMILEDLHWADDSTLSLLDHLTQRLSDLPLLVIGTYRDAELNVTRGLAKTLEDLLRGRLATSIRLEGLPRDEVGAMLNSLSGKSAPAAVVAEIFAETDGNPFFVEELFRHLEDENRLYDSSGQFRANLEIGELDAPPSVRLIVGRRLARLSDLTQKMLATAAVIGRSFSLEILQASSDADADSILSCVEEAEKAGLVFSIAENSKARFEFSHELTRQAVLAGLSAARRQRLHLEVAEAIERTCSTAESKYGGSLDDHVAELAYHYARSANTWHAVKYLHLAGERAAECCAMVEAERHYMTALKLLGELPETPERDRRELALQLAVGPALMSVKGWAAPEVERAYTRGRELCERVGELVQLFPILYGLWVNHLERLEFGSAYQIGEELLLRAESAGDSTLLLQAHHAFGVTAQRMGRFQLAREHLETALSLCGAQRSRPLGIDMEVVCLSQLAWTLWFLGYPDQALKMIHRAVELARALSDPFSLIFAKIFLCYLQHHRRDAHALQKTAQHVISICAEHGSAYGLAHASIFLGVAMTEQGRGDEGLKQMQLGLADHRASGAEINRSEFLYWLAEAYCAAGRLDEALDTLNNALGVAEERENLWLETEIYRLEGEFLLRRSDSDSDEAQACFQQGIAIARKQGAKSPELSATTSLARLLAKQGHRDKARAMLAEIYNWFTEGFDTPDLKDAKSLLDELNS